MQPQSRKLGLSCLTSLQMNAYPSVFLINFTLEKHKEEDSRFSIVFCGAFRIFAKVLKLIVPSVIVVFLNDQLPFQKNI